MASKPGVRTAAPAVVPVNGVELCVQQFGDPDDPAIVLIGGAAMPMDYWEQEFCERLAGSDRRVVRYDQRDTGRSVTYPPGAPAYTGRDLMADVVGLLDALKLPRAHLVGISMGGGCAQEVALEHPGRVATLTLMSTSAAVARPPGAPPLPPMSARLRARFDDPPPEPDWSDRPAVVDYLVDELRAYTGSLPFDEERMRALVGELVDRSGDVAAIGNHWLLEPGEPVAGRLDEIAVPTLVLHGTDDPLFPYGHGEALAAEIPGARLVPMPGVGHEVPPRPLWDDVIAAIRAHTDPAVAPAPQSTDLA